MDSNDDGCGDTDTLIREDERTIHNLLPNFADRTLDDQIPKEQRC